MTKKVASFLEVKGSTFFLNRGPAEGKSDPIIMLLAIYIRVTAYK